MIDEELLVGQQLELVEHRDHEVLANERMSPSCTLAVRLLVKPENLARNLVAYLLGRRRATSLGGTLGVGRALNVFRSIGN